MRKKLLLDPSFLLLIAGNALCIWYYRNDTSVFGNLIWIYWFQSVIIGLFNFLDLLTLKNTNPVNTNANDKGFMGNSKQPNGCAAWFFLFHYGFFHFGYMIFIATMYHSNLNGRTILLGLSAFFIEGLLSFRQKKILESSFTPGIGTIFFLPYLRVIPMHLTILLPQFFHIQPSMLFVVLKTFADVLFYIITTKIYRNKLNTA